MRDGARRAPAAARRRSSRPSHSTSRRRARAARGGRSLRRRRRRSSSRCAWRSPARRSRRASSSRLRHWAGGDLARIDSALEKASGLIPTLKRWRGVPIANVTTHASCRHHGRRPRAGGLAAWRRPRPSPDRRLRRPRGLPGPAESRDRVPRGPRGPHSVGGSLRLSRSDVALVITVLRIANRNSQRKKGKIAGIPEAIEILSPEGVETPAPSPPPSTSSSAPRAGT